MKISRSCGEGTDSPRIVKKPQWMKDRKSDIEDSVMKKKTKTTNHSCEKLFWRILIPFKKTWKQFNFFLIMWMNQWAFLAGISLNRTSVCSKFLTCSSPTPRSNALTWQGVPVRRRIELQAHWPGFVTPQPSTALGVVCAARCSSSLWLGHLGLAQAAQRFSLPEPPETEEKGIYADGHHLIWSLVHGS